MKKITLVILCLLATAIIFAQQKKSDITVSLPEGWIKVENSVLEHQYLKNGASFMIKEETVLNGKTLNEAVKTAKQNISNYFDDYKLLKEETIYAGYAFRTQYGFWLDFILSYADELSHVYDDVPISNTEKY